LEKIIKKIIWENTATIHSVLKKKNYKVKFLINSTLKKTNREIILEIIIIIINTKKKKTCWKHYNNSQCFVMKAMVFPHMI
jgi:hypothetical protein